MSDPVVVNTSVYSVGTYDAVDFDFTLAGSVTAGNVLLVTMLTSNNSPVNLGVTDDQTSPANTYVHRGHLYHDPVGVGYWTCVVANGGTVALHIQKFGQTSVVFLIVREVSGVDVGVTDGLPAFATATDGNATVLMNETSVPNNILFADYISFTGVTMNAPEAGWTADRDIDDGSYRIESIIDFPAAWGTFTAGWPGVTNPLLRRWVVGAIALIGVPITPTIQGVSTTEPQEGAPFTVTGVFFEASQGLGALRINGVTASITSWSDTAITCLPRRGLSPYGKTLGVRVFTNTLGSSNIKSVAKMLPKAGWSFIDVVVPLDDPSRRLRSAPDIAADVGDQITWAHHGFLVDVFDNGDASIDPSVASFASQVWNIDFGWGLVALQTFDAPPSTVLSLPTPPAGTPYPQAFDMEREPPVGSSIETAEEVVRARSRDFLAAVNVAWPPMNHAQFKAFWDWGKTDLVQWTSWFSIALPGRTAVLPYRPCRFTEPPKWVFVGGAGSGWYRVTGTLEHRGRSVL